MIKINSLKIKGLRGVKSELFLNLNEKSALFYGDSGSGKSSIADSFEWFLRNSIEHLSAEEIDRKGGITALRNISLSDIEESSVEVKFNCKNIDSEKKVFFKNSSLSSGYSNGSTEFNDFLEASKGENLVLRYRDLVNFVTAPKSERLKKLSRVIGFEEVMNTRSTIKTVVNKLKEELRIKNFDNQISIQDSNMIECFGHNITSERQFIDSINKLTEPFEIKKIDKLEEIDNVQSILKKPEDSQILAEQSFYNNLSDCINGLPSNLDIIESLYSKYHLFFEQIINDINKINNILLENLLKEGLRVLDNKLIADNNCPLCLQPKNKLELLNELEIRIKDLEKYKQEKSKIDEENKVLLKIVDESFQQIKALLSNKYLQLKKNSEIKEKLTDIKKGIEKYLTQLEVDVLEVKKIEFPDKLNIDRDLLKEILTICNQKKESEKTKLGNSKTNTVVKIELSKKAYNVINKLNKEKSLLESQKNSLELIYIEFAKKQKQNLDFFLSNFSKDINDLYQVMNLNEKIEDIKLISIEKEDEVIGLTLEFKFYNSQVSPPHKYLSEAHLNCLGLAFFLTSVKAFNKINKFFILDDIISSFDKDHRFRFTQLLIEKFSDYQIILLTHEKDWFESVASVVKGKNWIIKELKWTFEKGSYIDEIPVDAKEKIENQIKSGNIEGLGNSIRKYLEHLLKRICYELEVKVKFLYNDSNEDRMSHELLTALKSTINKNATTELKDNPTFDRLLSTFLANKTSHDSTFSESMGDLVAFWKDVLCLEDIFRCKEGDYISIRHYDNVNNKIRCGCGSKIYDWGK